MNAIYDSELYHHGIKGQKWGVRRYQNADGSLTTAGKKKYYRDASGLDKAKAKKQDAARRVNNAFNTAYNYDQLHIGLTKKSRATSKANWRDYVKESNNYRTKKAAYKSAKKEYKENVKNDPELQAHRAEVRKKVAIAAGATALAAVGAYALHKTGTDKKIADRVIQAGRGVSKKAYRKYYDRPIDVSAKVVPDIKKSLPAPQKASSETERFIKEHKAKTAAMYDKLDRSKKSLNESTGHGGKPLNFTRRTAIVGKRPGAGYYYSPVKEQFVPNPGKAGRRATNAIPKTYGQKTIKGKKKR